MSMPARKRRSAQRRRHNPLASQLIVGAVLLCLFALLSAMVWYGSRLESLTITEVEVEGGETLDLQAARAIAEEELRGAYRGIVPRRFAWAYPAEAIVKRIRELPRVKDAQLDQSEPRHLRVTLEEYRPFALWCEPGAASSSDCAFIDDQGFAFAAAPPLAGSTFLRYQNGNYPRVGETPFNAAFLRDTGYLAAEFARRRGFVSEAVERVGYDEASFYLQGGGILKTTLRQSAEDTLGNLDLILSAEEFRHLAPGAFAYIDLRFGDKVFVNEDGGLKDDEAIATSTAMN